MRVWDNVVWYLRFFDLVEESPTGIKLSVTKVAVWFTTTLNIITLISQSDWKVMAGTGFAHAVAVTGRATKRFVEVSAMNKIPASQELP